MPKKKIKLSITQTIAWTERLAMLLHSGISLAEALTIIGNDKKMMALNKYLAKSVSRGNSLSSVLRELKMSDVLVHLVHIGENSGSLAGALGHVAEHFRTKEEIKQKIISASLYPILIGLATSGVAGFLVAFIFPKIVPLFSSMNVVLPLPTRVLLYLNQFIGHYWLWVGCSVGVLIISATLLYRLSSWIRKGIESLLLRLPLFGEIMCDHGHARLFQIIAMQLEHGASLPHALTETAQSEGNIHFAEAFIYASNEISRGGLFSTSLSRYSLLFSHDILGLLSIAERTGDVSKSCSFISQNAKLRIDRTITLMSRFIEPVLMLGMGVVVGSIALSIIMPIYEITNKINMH